MTHPTSTQHEDFQGSTGFYDGPQTDPFTPSYLEAGLLSENVGRRRDGSLPPWMVPGSTKSPSEQYVKWFNYIWHTGDPSSWNASVFTASAVMIDPTGISRGAAQAAATFLLLFKYFPELRGEVVSWAANDREIFINWRFKLASSSAGSPFLVPVCDKFCFIDGLVSFRLAYFDIITLIGYLSENFGQDQLFDFLVALLRQGRKTGGIELAPRMIWNLLRGAFVWQRVARPTQLQVTPGDGVVSLQWPASAGATSYNVTRATALAGPYAPPSPAAASVAQTSYQDTDVVNGTPYWYLVNPNPHPPLAEWEAPKLSKWAPGPAA